MGHRPNIQGDAVVMIHYLELGLAALVIVALSLYYLGDPWEGDPFYFCVPPH